MRVLIDDGSRHTKMTGYGNLSRSIIAALHKHTDATVALRHRTENLPDWVSDREMLKNIPVGPDEKDFDVVLRIGTPKGKNSNHIPTVVYTQNALGDLRPEWVEDLSPADALIVPGEFDAQVFRKYFKSVFTCPQNVDEKTFKPAPHYRSEGEKCKSFIYVGSYSYRKGVDSMLDTFSAAFSNSEEVHLTMHCFSGLEKNGINDLLRRARHLPSNVKLSIFNGSVTPAWMSRIYSRHDAVVTFSRGEGWCMPMHEGLLCGKPVIATDCTAMGEKLPQDGVRRISAIETDIASSTHPLGGPMRKQYGFPGNTMWEVEKEDAIAALRDVYENLGTYSIAAHQGREFILKEYSKSVIATQIYDALKSVL